MSRHRQSASEFDLAMRVPAHALIERLMLEWRRGRIRFEDGRVALDDEVRGWYLGAVGERRVAQRLTELGPEWTVLHSVPVGTAGRDIDHVVIGPPGAFILNTKHHAGRRVWAAGNGLQLNGRTARGYITGLLRAIHDAEAKLRRAAGLSAEVRGALVFVDPARVTVRARPGDGTAEVIVVADDRLARELRRFPRAFSPEQLARIVEAARDPRTWLADASPWESSAALGREFDSLLAAIGTLRPTPSRPAPETATSRPRTPGGRAPASRPPAPTGTRRSRSRRLGALLAVLIPLAVASSLFQTAIAAGVLVMAAVTLR